jgi:spermidine synthase
MPPIYLGIFLLSAATLVLEIALTRLFAVAQGYHFAFMAVSIALLGFGASGSVLALRPPAAHGRHEPGRLPAVAAGLFTASCLGGYLLVNTLPFDAYTIGWERRQLAILLADYLALTVPFFFSGLVVGALLSRLPEHANRLYAANLAGSGTGCLLVVAALPLVGGAGVVVLATLLGLLAAIAFCTPTFRTLRTPFTLAPRPLRTPFTLFTPRTLLTLFAIALCLPLAFLLARPPSWLDVRMSPYKSLSQVLRFPDTRLLTTRWNAYSRVDVVQSSAIRSAPGLSLSYQQILPPQDGVTVDGDNLRPITALRPADLATPNDPASAAAFTADLPAALAYGLRPGGRVLVLEAGGGLDVLAALQHGARSVVAVEPNPLVVAAVREADNVYDDRRVTVVAENSRSYLRRTPEQFDIIQFSLSESFQAVTSGAYSLAENYLFTRESFADAYAHLAPGGLLVVTRWLQLPPSEELRAAAIAVAALEQAGVHDPARQLVAFRSFQTMTLLVKQGELTADELAAVRRFCDQRLFDLVALPGLPPGEANRYNILPDDAYYRTFTQLLSPERNSLLAEYAYNVTPATDDQPFFFHYFRWGQTPAILQSLGRTWQPFGGGGYLVLIALLVLAITASVVLIVIPLALRRRVGGAEEQGSRGAGEQRSTSAPLHPCTPAPSPWFLLFTYFACLGLGYLLVEIPLMQHFILFLGQPTYAFSTVLFALLVFSGLGSLVAGAGGGKGEGEGEGGRGRGVLLLALAALVVLLLLYLVALPLVFRVLLGQGLVVRLAVSIIALAPLGFLMGVPFPSGIALVNKIAPDLIPWVWGVNGCASVIASIGAALLAVSFGFSWVLLAAATSYAAALGAIAPLSLSGGRNWSSSLSARAIMKA